MNGMDGGMAGPPGMGAPGMEQGANPQALIMALMAQNPQLMQQLQQMQQQRPGGMPMMAQAATPPQMPMPGGAY